MSSEGRLRFSDTDRTVELFLVRVNKRFFVAMALETPADSEPSHLLLTPGSNDG